MICIIIINHRIDKIGGGLIDIQLIHCCHTRVLFNGVRLNVNNVLFTKIRDREGVAKDGKGKALTNITFHCQSLIQAAS